MAKTETTKHCPINKFPSAQPKKIDYKDTNLTKSEIDEGYTIERCTGNTHRRGCGKSYKALCWHTPSGCPHCPCSRVS